MSWTHEQINKLIELYQEHENLYTVKSKLYKNRNARIFSLNKIATELNEIRPRTTVDDIKKKFKGIRQTYLLEKRKYEASLKSVAGQDQVSFICHILKIYYY